MNWEVIEKRIEAITNTEGQELDPLSALAVRARAAGQPVSSVSITVRRSVGYGEFSVSATVSMSCPQNEAYVDVAAEVAYIKALEYVNDAFCNVVHDAPRIGEEP